MSKKPSPKKKYGPRAVAVPHYLNSLTSDVDRSHDARDENRIFATRIASFFSKLPTELSRRKISPCTVGSCR